MTENSEMRIGMLGCGTVGAAVIRVLSENEDDIVLRSGCHLRVTRVAVRDSALVRDVPLDPSRFVTDPRSVVTDPEVDIVCELIGGIEPARSLILQAFANGKSVVTANKELLANPGKELFDAAEATGTRPLLRGRRGRAGSRSSVH